MHPSDFNDSRHEILVYLLPMTVLIFCQEFTVMVKEGKIDENLKLNK